MNHPNVPLPIDRDAADLTEDPIVRELLRPGGIDCEGRDVAGCRNIRKRECDGRNQDGESV
jgi:hypothetical protein